MGNFNRDNRRGGGRSFGGGSRGPREMFKAICDDCGKKCEIPFKPRDGRPVFCSDCFEEQGGPAPFKPERRHDRRDRDIRTYKPDESTNYKKELADISDKLKQIIILMKEQNIPTTPAEEAEKPKKKAVKKKKASPKTKKIVKKLKAKKTTKKKK